MNNACPTCGRAYRKAKAHTTDNDIFATYHASAPVEDVRFALRVDVAMSDTLRADWTALLTVAPSLRRTEVYRRLGSLQDRWRREQGRIR